MIKQSFFNWLHNITLRKLTEGKQTEMPVGLSLNEVAIDDIF